MARAVAGTTRADLAALSATDGQGAILWEDGREGICTFDASDLSAWVDIDTLQGVVIPPASDPSGASGAWLRRNGGGVNVKWFGATGDGTTDDTGALQAAIDYAEAAGGATVHIPEGVFRTGTLSLPENVHIRGANRYSTRLVATANLNAALIERIGTLAAPINRGGVESLTIVGSGKSNTSMIGIKSVYTNRGIIRDIDVFSTYIGIYAENVWQDAWDYVHVHGGGGDQNYIGFYMAPKAAVVGVSNAVIAHGCIAQGVEKWGFRLMNFDGSKFTACEAMNGEIGWWIGAPTSGSEIVQFGHFTACLGDTNSLHNWRIEKGSASAFQRVQFSNCWAGTAGTSNVFIAGVSQCVFSNWQIIASAGHGVHIFNSSRIVISCCHVRDYNSVTGANHGILLENSAAITLNANQVYTLTGGTGKSIAETGTSNTNIITSNTVAGGTTIIGGATVSANNVVV